MIARNASNTAKQIIVVTHFARYRRLDSPCTRTSGRYRLRRNTGHLGSQRRGDGHSEGPDCFDFSARPGSKAVAPCRRSRHDRIARESNQGHRPCRFYRPEIWLLPSRRPRSGLPGAGRSRRRPPSWERDLAELAERAWRANASDSRLHQAPGLNRRPVRVRPVSLLRSHEETHELTMRQPGALEATRSPSAGLVSVPASTVVSPLR